MEYKRLLLIGDSHFRGDGAEWPKIYGHLGPIPKEYKSNIWLTKIKKGYPDELEQLHTEFYSGIGKNLSKNSNDVIEYRKKYSFGALIASKFKLKYENYALKTNLINQILPFFKYHCEDQNFKNTLVLAGIPPAHDNIVFNQQGTNLKNITIDYISSSILLIKEYVENRGGHFMYMHTEDYPEDLYNPELNPYFMDLLPFLLHQGDISSLLSSAYYWRKFDGKHYDAGAQKSIADNLLKKLDL